MLHSQPGNACPAIPEVTKQRLLADLQQLVRPRHARWDELGLMTVRSYVLEQLQAHGPVEQHGFGEGGDAGMTPVLVAAHYNGPLGSPAAEDNATGVAALLKLARPWAVNPP